MPKKNRKKARRQRKTVRKKVGKSSRPEKKPHVSRAVEPKTLKSAKIIVKEPIPSLDYAREGTGFKIAIDRISGETIIGDILVVFPKTREVFKKKGLRLDVEDAGDIYMTLEAFAALQGLETQSLVLELIEASKEPQPQAQPVPALIPPSTS